MATKEEVQLMHDAGVKAQSEPAELKNFEVRLKALAETRKLFYKTVDEINLLRVRIDPTHEIDFQTVEAFENMSIKAQLIAEELIKPADKETAPPVEVPATKPVARLPPIELQGFAGEPKEWPIFYECFKSIIHDNVDLTTTDKIHYLLGKLSGKALAASTGLPPIGENYQIIWDTLVAKYQDPRLLANTYLDQIMNFKMTNVNLTAFVEKFGAAVIALQQLDLPDLADYMLSYIALMKLDPGTKLLFENIRRSSKIPSYKEIIEFVKEQEKINNRTQAPTRAPPTMHSTKAMTTRSHTFLIQGETAENCPICQNRAHQVFKCPKFTAKAPAERYKLAKERSLCLNCLGQHRVADCKSTMTCRICHYKHHTLLHFYKGSVPEAETFPASTSASTSAKKEEVVGPSTTTSFSATTHGAAPSGKTVLLSTVVVNTVDAAGRKTNIRLLLDSGSQAHFLTMSCARRIGVQITRSNSAVRGIGNLPSKVHGRTCTTISSRFDDTAIYTLDMLIINKVSDEIPTSRIPRDAVSHLMHLPLADSTFWEPGRLDGVIGADLFPILLGQRKVVGPPSTPIAIETSLGYVVMGTAITNSPREIQSFHAAVDHLEPLLTKFWELEDIPANIVESSDDLECEKIYKSTVKREVTGRYTVALPFKESPDKLGESRGIALKRFLNLERKFTQHAAFKNQYVEVMQGYVNAGYVSKVINDSSSEANYYIPHHAVTKIDSVSTPLRCVFDASTRTTASTSLNDLLHTGSKLQLDIVSVLLNFRLFEFALTADITKMYLQINLCEDHRRYQRILWRSSMDDPIETYQLNTVCFGVKSSPFLALRTLHQLAADEEHKFPLAAEIVRRDFYMDDLICSVQSHHEATLLYRQLIGLFKAGCFELCKWAVNSKELLEEIPAPNRSPKVINFDISYFKVLGLQWSPHPDNFSFGVNVESTPCTKRNLLSTVARLFDPLGLIAPVTLIIKLLIKQLWMDHIDWDQLPPEDIIEKWRTLQSELPLLREFVIPRHLGIYDHSTIELIGFTDACMTSYGCVIYLRSTRPKDKVRVNLVCAKTKVSPTKILTIPRVELCAAHLLAKLLNFVREAFANRIEIKRIYACSDSTIALSWIQAPPHRWTTFVAHRVAKIQEWVPPDCWYHIDGKLNISDGLSRGMLPTQFLSCEAWRDGPSWLLLEEAQWPIRSLKHAQSTSLEENLVSLIVTGNQNPNLLDTLTERCSAWRRLLRITVYVLRFARILDVDPIMSSRDLEKAEIILIRLVQKKHFSAEISLLKKGELCSPHIRMLHPFLQEGLIRVGGRLSNAPLDYDQQHPILCRNGIA